MNSKNLCLTEEKEKIGNSILKWSEGLERELNVITIPWNGADIFLKTIFKYVKEDNNVLYITDEKENIQLIESIKKKSDYRGYIHLRGTSDNVESNLVITDFKAALNLNEKFDFIVYDEINSMPKYDNKSIWNLLQGLSKENGKKIFYSVEGIFKNKRDIILPVRDRKAPLIEPRDIQTRIDINKDIPYMVYDYIKWSINNNRSVLIYVPKGDKVEKVYNYIRTYNWDKSCNISYFIKGKSDMKTMMNFYKIRNSIMITDEFRMAPPSIANTDIMVYFANDDVFNHKILTHICSRVSRTERDSRGEVIFLYNEKNRNTEAAIDIVKKFNKEAWEMGFLKI